MDLKREVWEALHGQDKSGTIYLSAKIAGMSVLIIIRVNNSIFICCVFNSFYSY